MKYQLSNTQRKDLLMRGTQIQIALPLPLDWPEDASGAQLRGFFLDILPEITPAQLRDVTETELCVRPYVWQSPIPALSSIVGRDQWHMVVGVVVGTLVYPTRPRHIRPGVQWPGDIRGMLPSGTVVPEPTRMVTIKTIDAGEWTIRHEPGKVTIFDQHGMERGRYKPDIDTLAQHLALAMSHEKPETP